MIKYDNRFTVIERDIFFDGKPFIKNPFLKYKLEDLMNIAFESGAICQEGDYDLKLQKYLDEKGV